MVCLFVSFFLFRRSVRGLNGGALDLMVSFQVVAEIANRWKRVLNPSGRVFLLYGKFVIMTYTTFTSYLSKLIVASWCGF